MADNTQIYPKGYVYGINPNEENDVRLKDLADVDAKTPADGDALVYNILKNAWEPKKIEGGEPGPGGTSNYNELTNKPSINGVELVGNKTSQDLHITGGSGTDDYDQLQNRPAINGHTLTGDQTAEDLGIETGTDDYTDLSNKPQINGHTLSGNKTAEDLGITDTDDYDELTSRPSINGVTLTGNKTSADLGIETGTDNYTDLENKPQINGVTLNGNKSTSDLALMASRTIFVSSSHYPGGTWQSIPVTVGHLLGVTLYKGGIQLTTAYMKREAFSQTTIKTSFKKGYGDELEIEVNISVDVVTGNLQSITTTFMYPKGYNTELIPTEDDFVFTITDLGASAASTASDPIQIVNGDVRLKIDNTLGIDSNGNLSVVGGGGGAGTTNYNDLLNRPQINGHTLEGNQTPADLGITEGTLNYNELNNRPTINGVLLSGNKTAADLGISGGIVPVISMSKTAEIDTTTTDITLGNGKSGLIKIKASFPAVKKSIVTEQEESYTATCTYQGVFDRTNWSQPRANIILRNIDANSPFEWMELVLGTAEDTNKIKYAHLSYMADKDHQFSSQTAEYYDYIPYSGTTFADNFTIDEYKVTELASPDNSTECISGTYEKADLASTAFPLASSTIKALSASRGSLSGIYTLGVNAGTDEIVLVGERLGNVIYITLTKDNTTGNFETTVKYLAVGNTASQLELNDYTISGNLSIMSFPDITNWGNDYGIITFNASVDLTWPTNNVLIHAVDDSGNDYYGTYSGTYVSAIQEFTLSRAAQHSLTTIRIVKEAQTEYINTAACGAFQSYKLAQAESHSTPNINITTLEYTQLPSLDDNTGIDIGTISFSPSVNLTWPTTSVIIAAADTNNNYYYGVYSPHSSTISTISLIGTHESADSSYTLKLAKDASTGLIDVNNSGVFQTYKLRTAETHTTPDITITDLVYTQLSDASDVYTKSETYTKTEVNNLIGAASHVYSTTEHVVGTWIDGKPLYELSIDGTSPSTVGTEGIIASIPSNVDSIFISEGFLKASDNEYLPINWTHTTSLAVTSYIDKRQGVMMTTKGGYNNKPVKIVIKYTKTTDTPNT